MRTRHLALMGLTACVVISGAGCLARWRRWRDEPPPPKFYRDPVFPGTRPPGPAGQPEILMPAPNGSAAPALPPPTSSQYGSPNIYYDPRLAPARGQTAEPPLAAPRPPSGVQLLPPDLRDPRPKSADPSSPSTGLPVGIHAFAEVADKIATGVKPDPEGFDWLAANRYRTVLHLRKPDTANAGDRALVERRGLKYVSLEVSASALNRETVDAFSRIVTDPMDQPVFVYDHNGLLNGAMWYLHFRITDKLSDPAARNKAIPLGLKETGNNEVTALWLAIQKIIADMP